MPTSTLMRILPVLALTAGPAFAGAVYVPILPAAGGNVTYAPQIVVGNAATAKRIYSTYFIAENANGMSRATQPAPFEIPAGDSVPAIPPSSVGLLEIGGVADILVHGTMVGTAPRNEVVAFPLPVITSSNAASPSGKQHLLGLVKTGALFTNLYVVNLGQVAATCSVRVLDDKGQVLIAATLAFKALSMRQFPDALQLAPIPVDDARAEVSCSEGFYSFATVHSTPQATGEPTGAVIVPAGTGASSLPVPGNEGVNCTASTASHCYALPGLVFEPQKGVANQKRVKFNVDQGTYKKVHLSMEVFFSGLNPSNPGGLHQFFWLAINGKNPDLVGFTSLRDNKTVMLRTGIGLDAGHKSKKIKAASLIEGETYLLDYIYDTESDNVVWTITEKNSGRLVVSVADTPNVNNVNFGGNGHMAVDLSFDGSNPEEPPSHGWRYENLFFEIFRR